MCGVILTVFGVKESLDPDPKQRAINHKLVLSSILRVVKPDFSLDAVKCLKLGKFSANLARSRSLKIPLSNHESVVDITHAYSKVKETGTLPEILKDIYFASDKTD